MFKTFSISLVALGVTTMVAVADTGDAKAPAAEAGTAGFSVVVSGDDSLEDFQAVVDSVLGETSGPPDSNAQGVKGDAASAAVATDPTRSPGVRHREHLGLGFGHGSSSGGQNKPNYNSTDRINPGTDDCDGNGHPRNPDGNPDGNLDSEAQAQGFAQHPGTFGHGDCGEPSPSD